MKELLNATAARAIRYLEDVEERRVSPSPEALAEIARFDEPLPEASCDPEAVIALLDEIGSPASMAMAGPRYFGFVIGGSLPVAVAADWLTTAWDQNCGLYQITPMAAFLEQVALGWLVDLLGLPAGSGGGFVTGATVANFTALAAARHAVLERAGWNVEADGLFGAPPITVVVSAETHPTLFKSLGMLGLGRNRVLRVPTDGQGRMRADAMPPLAGPTIVCTQAGNVNTGAFDPVGRDRGDRARSRGLGPRRRRLRPLGGGLTALRGSGARASGRPTPGPPTRTRRSTCPTTAASPSCATPMPCGRRWRSRPSTCRRRARGATRSDFTPELSRRARGIDVWAVLRQLGRAGVAELVEGCHANAARIADGLTAAGHEVLNEVVFNQVLVSFGAPEETHRVIAALQEDGTCWCGGTEWQGRTAMRISVSSWATTGADIDRSLEAMVRVAASSGV